MTKTEINEMQSPQVRIIETDSFPSEFLSVLATRESWRKEIYRPIYHAHKWWAKRLGTIFRGIILGCLLPEQEDLRSAFYSTHDRNHITIFDPFMGSGTTVGEAHKLGCVALGRDINPVACESARIALGHLDSNSLEASYFAIERSVGARIRNLYRSTDEQGCECDVLYYFWVKQAVCPSCKTTVDLFPTRIIARNAAPNRKEQVRVCCPKCGWIFAAFASEKHVVCPKCSQGFSPHSGQAHGANATCPNCDKAFTIAKAVSHSGNPPTHRLYAKLLLSPTQGKVYLPATESDIADYERCVKLLQAELASGAIRLPELQLDRGHNTRQAMNYGYRTWRDFFNDRQLLALGWLQDAIVGLPNPQMRDAFLILFSGVLEFNNLFASYKGEGTGAVRHMFAHHILKPERLPIEANVWGTSSSSGAFSTLFKTRLLRAAEYQQRPFELTENGSRKVYAPLTVFSEVLNEDWPVEGKYAPGKIYLSCGSSEQVGLNDRSIDFIVTDPPFFDNVHYSELADFFYAWQSLYPRGFIGSTNTTRSEHEVQDTDPVEFARKLRAVFVESYRVLKDEGLLVFSYQHSRTEGWVSLLQAALGAGFSIINAHPVKSEMSVAKPKSSAKEPIQLDVLFVCRKASSDRRGVVSARETLSEVKKRASRKLQRLASIGLDLSRNDRKIAVYGQFIAALGPTTPETAVDMFLATQQCLDQIAETVTLPATLDAPKAIALRLW